MLKYRRPSAANGSLKIPRSSFAKSTTEANSIFSGVETSKAMNLFVQPPSQGCPRAMDNPPLAGASCAAASTAGGIVPGSSRYHERQRSSAAQTSVPGLGQNAVSWLHEVTGTAAEHLERSFTCGSADTS